MKYKVCNWERYQHYTDRCPPWIKLHVSTLSSRDWVMLDDASRVLMIAIMLIASRDHGVFDGDPEYIQRIAYLKRPAKLKPLIEAGFIEALADASDCKRMLANDTTEKNREEKSREEEEKSNSCSEPDKPASKPVIQIPLVTDGMFDVLAEDCDEWRKAFPAVDIVNQLHRMVVWLNANPTKRKTRTGIKRFIVRWLAKEQDRGGPAVTASNETLTHNADGTPKTLDQMIGDIESNNRGFGCKETR